MTRSTLRRALLLLAGSALFAGCVATRQANDNQPTTPAATMYPGMVMPDGSVMGTTTAPASSAPMATSRMICSPEARSDIAAALALATPLPATASWAEHLYTCTYRLPYGQLIAAVKETPDAASTTAYYHHLLRQLGHTTGLAGLTDTAAGTPSGTVVLIKDNNVLTVDATRLPAEFGPQHQRRADFAYEVASIILGCWTGDDN